ncbi:hypothetical protein LWI29_025936 [Acer saccharum]|uniref:Uncharacterized protein n=1 Tax=Acer saccharum TaxID=4024 RepID=A0AA39W2W7_ACESA|nr:hypothetical protein LWI29_025936 [Acer saccharum]
MSNLKLISFEEALKRQMERIEKRKGKRAAHVPAPKVQETINVEPSDSIELASKKKKRPCSNDEASSINVKFSPDICIYLNLSSMLKQVDQLLFPKDDDRLGKMRHSRVVDWGLTGAFQDTMKEIEVWEQWKKLKALEVKDVYGVDKDFAPKEQSDAIGQTSKDISEIDPPVLP